MRVRGVKNVLDYLIFRNVVRREGVLVSSRNTLREETWGRRRKRTHPYLNRPEIRCSGTKRSPGLAAVGVDG